VANTLLTPTAVTREALRVLHQKCNFIKTINRQYDDSFAKTGAKIGDSLKIRLPNQYTVRSGAVMDVQNTSESSVTLQVATQKGVDMNFTSSELTLSLDDFSKRILEPAMSVLAAAIESDVMNVYKDIYQQSSNVGAAATSAKLLAGKKLLVDALAPSSPRWRANYGSQENVDLVEALKTLFHASNEIKDQYIDGAMGTALGFDHYENTLWPRHTSGTENGASTTITVNGSNQTGASVTVTNGSSKTLAVGDIITFSGCNRVHPETKHDTGVAQQFVVTTALTSSGTSVAISPSIITSGPTQNVSASPTTAQAITKVGGASTAYNIGMLYHQDAFTFASADLVMPDGVDWKARENFDGISMRIVRQYTINNDQLPCRIDVLYGYKTIRAALAARFANN